MVIYSAKMKNFDDKKLKPKIFSSELKCFIILLKLFPEKLK